MKVLRMAVVGALVASCCSSIALATPTQENVLSGTKPRLRGVNVVRGSETSWTDIRLPRKVDPHARSQGGHDRQQPFQIDGNGRVVGFALVRLRASAPVPDGPSLLVWSLGHCVETAEACEDAASSINWVLDFNLKGRYLPRGNYRLYLIADGAPAKVRFELAGLTGKRVLRPSHKADAQIVTVATSSSQTGGESAFWGGHDMEDPPPGIALTGMWVDGGNGTSPVGEAGICAYQDEVPDDDLAYAPYCPRADASEERTVVARFNEVSAVALGSAPPAGLGTWATAAGATRAGAVGLRLTF